MALYRYSRNLILSVFEVKNVVRTWVILSVTAKLRVLCIFELEYDLRAKALKFYT
jgi:hypothetical protein